MKKLQHSTHPLVITLCLVLGSSIGLVVGGPLVVWVCRSLYALGHWIFTTGRIAGWF
jgi:hypothetical protein